MTETGTSVETAPQTEQQVQQAEAKAQLDQMMQLNLNGVLPSQEAPSNGHEQQTGQEQVIVQPENQVQPEVNTDVFGVFKEKFGYAAPEDAIKEIEELRQLKANPQVEKLKFENERSEKIARALAAGKLEEVYETLQKEHRLTSLSAVEVTKDTAPEIIKLGMQIKYPTLTPAQIEFQYKQEYGFPKEPVIKDTEEEPEFAERHNEWKEQVSNIQMKMEIAATMAKPELEAAKSKIVYPEIEQPDQSEFVQWKQLMDEQAKLDTQIQETYKTVSPKEIETKIPFIDETNKIKFEFQYEPDADSFKKSVDVAKDIDSLLKHFVKSDGTFDREEHLAAIHFGLNRKNIITEAMKQAKNATIKSFLPDNSGGTQRQFPQTQVAGELDQMMQMAGVIPARN